MRTPKTTEKPSPTCSPMAKRIVNALMQDFWGEKAVRLQLLGPKGKNLGGLCRASVEKIIDSQLLEPNTKRTPNRTTPNYEHTKRKPQAAVG